MPKKLKVKLGLKNLAMLLNYFDYIFVHLRQKVRLRPELSPKFLSTLGLNLARTQPEKQCPTDNSVPYRVQCILGFYSLFTNFIACAF